MTWTRPRRRSDYTAYPVHDFAMAIFAELFTIQLKPDDDHAGLPPIRTDYETRKHLFGRSNDKTIRYLRHMNANGYHVFGRPNSNRHILLDDIDQDSLDRLMADGLAPSAVVLTSKGNFQTWITVSKQDIDDATATMIARLLAKRYEGDLNSAKAAQLGRLPGFTNRKARYRQSDGTFPFVYLRRWAPNIVATNGLALIDEARAEIQRQAAPSSDSYGPFQPGRPASPSSPSPLGACESYSPRFDPSSDFTLPADFDAARYMSAELAHETYDEIIQEASANYGRDYSADRSAADYCVARTMRAWRCPPDEIAALLSLASGKAKERGIAYVTKTVRNAMSR